MNDWQMDACCHTQYVPIPNFATLPRNYPPRRAGSRRTLGDYQRIRFTRVSRAAVPRASPLASRACAPARYPSRRGRSRTSTKCAVCHTSCFYRIDFNMASTSSMLGCRHVSQSSSDISYSKYSHSGDGAYSDFTQWHPGVFESVSSVPLRNASVTLRFKIAKHPHEVDSPLVSRLNVCDNALPFCEPPNIASATFHSRPSPYECHPVCLLEATVFLYHNSASLVRFSAIASSQRIVLFGNVELPLSGNPVGIGGKGQPLSFSGRLPVSRYCSTPQRTCFQALIFSHDVGACRLAHFELVVQILTDFRNILQQFTQQFAQGIRRKAGDVVAYLVAARF